MKKQNKKNRCIANREINPMCVFEHECQHGKNPFGVFVLRLIV